MGNAGGLEVDGLDGHVRYIEASLDDTGETSNQAAEHTRQTQAVAVCEKRPALITVRALPDGTGEIAVVWQTEDPGRTGVLKARVPNLDGIVRWHQDVTVCPGDERPEAASQRSQQGHGPRTSSSTTSAQRFTWPLSETDRAKARAALARRLPVTIGMIKLHPHRDPEPRGRIWGVTPDGKVAVAAKAMNDIDRALSWCDATCQKQTGSQRLHGKRFAQKAWRLATSTLQAARSAM